MGVANWFRVAVAVVAIAGCGAGEGGKVASPGGSLETAEKAVDALARASAERLVVADLVAAAKWGTDKPIEDPAREAQVIDDMTKRAAEMGVDRDAVQRIVRDQIEANKLVQRGLHRRWEATPEARPTSRPDLAKDVRPALDRIGGELLNAIQGAQPVLSGAQCRASVSRAERETARAKGFDELHREGLTRALLHTCRSH